MVGESWPRLNFVRSTRHNFRCAEHYRNVADRAGNQHNQKLGQSYADVQVLRRSQLARFQHKFVCLAGGHGIDARSYVMLHSRLQPVTARSRYGTFWQRIDDNIGAGWQLPRFHPAAKAAVDCDWHNVRQIQSYASNIEKTGKAKFHSALDRQHSQFECQRISHPKRYQHDSSCSSCRTSKSICEAAATAPTTRGRTGSSSCSRFGCHAFVDY